MVRNSTVEETLNAMLDAKTDWLCRAQRYERTEVRKVREGVPTSGTCRRKGVKHSQPIECNYPYMWLKRSRGDGVCNVSLLATLGVNDQGFSEVLAIAEGEKAGPIGRCFCGT